MLTRNDAPTSVYYAGVTLEVGLPDGGEDLTVRGGAVSDDGAYVLVSSGTKYYIEQFSLSGQRENIYDVSFSEPDTFFLVLREDRLIIVANCLDNLDFYHFDLQSGKLMDRIRIPRAEDTETFGNIIGYEGDLLYVEVLTGEGLACRGFDIRDGLCVLALTDDVWAEAYFFLDGDLYALCDTEKDDVYDVCLVTDEGRVSKKYETAMPKTWEMLLYQEEMQFLRDKDGLWYLNEEEHAWKNLLSWQNSGVDEVSLPRMDHYYVSPMKDRILLFGEQTKTVQLLYPSSDPTEGKTILKVAGSEPTESMMWAISEFNRTNEDYAVRYMSYDEELDPGSFRDGDGWIDITAYNDALTDFLWKRVMGGDGTDILIRSFQDSAQNKLSTRYFEYGGLLSDLAPYWDDMEESWKEKFLSNMVLSMVYQDQMYAIPLEMSVSTAVKEKSCPLGADASYEEWLSYAEEYAGDIYFTDITNRDFLKECLTYDLDTFLIGANGKPGFDCEEFRALMKLAKDYCMSQTEWSNATDDTEGKFLCLERMISAESVYDVVRPDPYGDVEFYGHVTSDGADACFVPGLSASITSCCTDKDGAWEFICFLLSAPCQEYYMRAEEPFLWNIPVRWDSLDFMLDFFIHPDDHEDYYRFIEQFDDEVEETAATGDNGEGGGSGGESRTLSEEEAVLFKQWISGIRHCTYPDMEVIGIILEEADPYFAGQRSLDETIALINNRVQLVLDERK
ncbi:MAG: hypothetical protein J5379_10910 [Clostridiales bacterium]|nr:hypothetical protein [Clostridiales bacterium]